MDAMTPEEIDVAGAIRVHVSGRHRTGFLAGGSGHMAHVELSNLDILTQAPTTRGGKPAIEVTYRYELWIDREFEMTPETMHLFKEVHQERAILQDGKVFPAGD